MAPVVGQTVTGSRILCASSRTAGLVVPEPADTLPTTTLDDFVITADGASRRRLNGVVGGEQIGRAELFKAACCNLGESFTTSPSVDVSYSDAATGARQIKLLGLPGTYVQLLTENMPGSRVAIFIQICPGPMDEEHSGVERHRFGEKRL